MTKPIIFGPNPSDQAREASRRGYKLLQELTQEDRDAIYEYAMQRSDELVEEALCQLDGLSQVDAILRKEIIAMISKIANTPVCDVCVSCPTNGGWCESRTQVKRLHDLLLKLLNLDVG